MRNDGRYELEHTERRRRGYVLGAPVVLEEPSFLVLESGRIRFFVLPRFDVASPIRASDLVRFDFTLAPNNKRLARRVTVAKKRLPDDRFIERQWAWVDRVAPASQIVSDLGPTMGSMGSATLRDAGDPRHPPRRGTSELARGTYAITAHRDHTHLLYALDAARDREMADALPLADLGDPLCLLELRRQLHVVPHASYIAAAFHPEARRRFRDEGRPELVLRVHDERLRTPRRGQRRPDEQRLAPLEPAFLDHEGAELVLIGGRTPRLEASSPDS